MKFAALIFGAAVVMRVAGWAGEPDVTRGVPAQSPAAAVTSEHYRTLCQMCHGEKGVTTVKDMSFVGRKWKHGTSTTAIAKIITDGVPGTAMMPFKERLSQAEITALARYVRAFDKTLKRERQ